MGQWTGVVRIVRPSARGRPGRRWSPITGAGLDPSCTPVGIPSNSSDGEGCWGRETAGTDAHIGVEEARALADPHGRTGVPRTEDPGPAALQPVGLLLIAFQLCIRALQGTPIPHGTIHRIAVPLISTPFQ